MTTSAIRIEVPNANNVIVTDGSLIIELDDGRTVSVPTAWYPRLLNASKKERENWRLLGKGRGIHWESLDEDISVEGLLAGQPSGESQSFFKKWIESRN